MNSAASTHGHLQALVILTACLAPLWFLRGAAADDLPNSAESAVCAFQDAVFLSTRDTEVDGRRAVDLYWKSTELSSAVKVDAAFNQKLAALYADLEGDRVVRVALRADGWTGQPTRAPLVLMQGQPFATVLVVVANQTDHRQEVTLRVGGDAASVAEQSIQLAPGQTTALAPTLQANKLGPFNAMLDLIGERRASIPLSGEVRHAVRLRLRVLDPDSTVTPARVYIHGADGLSHTPVDAFDRIMWMTAEHYFYTPGVSELVLPAGRTRVEVRKGFDFTPIIRDLNLTPGRPESVELRLAWLRNMHAAGWRSGDDHVHGNYTGEPWSKPADDLLAIRAEGLDVGNMMVSNSTGTTIHDERYFEGRPSAVSTRDTILYWNQEMRTWSYGHLVLLNLKRLVRPLYTGFPGAQNWEDEPSNYSQAQQAREQGGVAVYAHPALRFDDIPTGSLASESVVDVALGGIDAFEVFCSHDEPSMELWYRFLNLGFKVGLAGGSDAFLNQRFSFLPGGERMYVHTGHHGDYASWINELRRGRSFATVGPLMLFDGDGEQPGSERRFAAPAKVSLGVSVVSPIPVSKLEIVANGQVVAEASSPMPTEGLAWRGVLGLAQSSWIAARVWGPNSDRIANGPSRWSERHSPTLVLLAHSSPSYVYVDDQPIFSETARQFCLHWLDALIERIRTEGKFTTEAHRDDVLATFMRARAVYQNMGTHEKAKP